VPMSATRPTGGFQADRLACAAISANRPGGFLPVCLGRVRRPGDSTRARYPLATKHCRARGRRWFA